MKINVVTVRSGWILQKIAERIVSNCPKGVEMVLSHAPAFKANNFYVDITNCYRGRHGGKDIGLFTHVHENNRKHIQTAWFTLNHIVHMSTKSLILFTGDPRFVQYTNLTQSVMMPGEIPPGFEYEKPVIGIFQRGKYKGKGFDMMMKFADHEVASDYRWLFVGNDWDEVIRKLEQKTDVLGYNDDKVAWPHTYLNLYNMVNYVLIPSEWEGGPMSLIEAAALGKEIIGPREVGWVDKEIPVRHKFVAGNHLDLKSLLEDLVFETKKAREIVEGLSYKKYSQHVVDCFRD